MELLRAARSGDAIEVDGRSMVITPAPGRDGPGLALGGSSAAAAQRAARIADGFTPSLPEHWEHYRAARIELGHADPGPHFPTALQQFHLATDVEQGWADVGAFMLHETNAYGAWMRDAGLEGMYDTAADVESVRASGFYRVLTPDMMVDELTAAGPYAFVLFHPLMGGIPPEMAWSSLHLFEHEVLPRL
jgi:alkanesulfonate monooxygenase SsuD/methylene tetrahydromethanopterin reductase-like flavin-dependent oxidoreductase (luciferase family)